VTRCAMRASSMATIVIIEQRQQAPNGSIVVALIRGAEARLKRIAQMPGEIIIKAENPEIPPLRFRPDEVEIQGVVVGQMRTYRWGTAIVALTCLTSGVFGLNC
jgi:SOS-response transcriptional repressor LexA